MIELTQIKRIINEWDPIGLFPLAPKDEYNLESELILKRCYKYSSKIDINYLAQIIYDVFTESFGDDVFCKTKQNCVEIARSILSNI